MLKVEVDSPPITTTGGDFDIIPLSFEIDIGINAPIVVIAVIKIGRIRTTLLQLKLLLGHTSLSNTSNSFIYKKSPFAVH